MSKKSIPINISKGVLTALAGDFDINKHRDILVNNLGNYTIKVGVVKKTETTYSICEVRFPSLSVDVVAATAYNLRSNGLRKRDGTPFYSRRVIVNPGEGEEATFNGNVNLSPTFWEKVRMIIGILFYPNETIRISRGLTESDPRVREIQEAITSYNKQLKTIRGIDTDPQLLKQEVVFITVDGNELERRIDDFRDNPYI